MFKTYILENPVGIFYIGYTSNLDVRLSWHNDGKSRFTKNKGPWSVVYTKVFSNKTEALKHEQYLKSIKNKKYLRQSIIGE